MARYIIGISGASGITLAHKTIDVLSSLGHQIHIVMTKDAFLTAIEEMGHEYSTPEKFLSFYKTDQLERIRMHKNNDFSSEIASGSYPIDGMLIIPCSMATLAGVAIGLSDNLLRRAADVTLKERRKLIIVPRESPFSAIHLENMLKITRVGGVIVPPIPAWYTKPKSLEDVENFIVGRALDALGVDANLYPRWGVN